MRPLNAQDFGFLPTGGGTENRAAWEAAITAAQEQGQPLYVPAGTYALELTPVAGDVSKGAILNRSLTIYGDGPEHTVIDVHPKTVSFEYHVIWWDTPDLHVNVKGLKVLGPDGTNAAHPDETPPCSFMRGITAQPYGSDNRITVDDLVVTGKFEAAVYTANGDGLVDVRNSDLTALSVCVAVFETTNSFLDKRFHADNCRFASGVPAAETSNGEPFGICVYLHPHVAARVTNCRFYDNPRAAIKQYGEAAVGHAPKYSQYLGCHFYNCTGFTIITPGEEVLTQIEACSFDKGYIACRNRTGVVGCEFRTSAGIVTTAGHRVRQFEVNVVGCGVHQSDSGTAFQDAEGMSLLVRDCVFTFDEDSGAATGVLLGRASYGEVSGCRFVGRAASAPDSAFAVALNPSAGSRLKVERCSFAGSFPIAAVGIQPGAEDASAEINGCDFSQVAAAPIHFNTGSLSYGNVVRGRDNVFNERPISTGGFGTDLKARLRPRSAMAVVPVVAQVSPAGSPPRHEVILDRSHDTFHVIGHHIDYVFVGAERETNKFEGPVHLIADNPWTLSNGGNIRPARLTARRPKEVVTLFHDPAAGLWFEE